MAPRFNSDADARLLGERLRRARKKAGLTQQLLGTLTGVDHSQISRIEGGRMTTESPNVQKLCTFLKVSTLAGPGAPPDPDGLGRRVRTLAATTPAAAAALAAMVSALEALTESP